MTGPTEATADASATDAVAAKGAAEAARERQSHMRHDLRAPLAVIYPLLSLLLDEGAGELTAQQREYLQVLERNVVRLEALVTGVADSGWADCSVAPALPRGDRARRTSPRRSSPFAAWTTRTGRRSTWRRARRRPRVPGPTVTTSARSSPASCATRSPTPRGMGES